MSENNIDDIGVRSIAFEMATAPSKFRPHKLKSRDVKEMIDLYRWGASLRDIGLLYGVCISTVTSTMTRFGIPKRNPYRPALVTPNYRDDNIKSTRPQLPSGVKVRVDDRGEIDRLFRSCVRASQDKHTGGHQ